MHEPTLSPEVLLPVPSAVALMLGIKSSAGTVRRRCCRRKQVTFARLVLVAQGCLLACPKMGRGEQAPNGRRRTVTHDASLFRVVKIAPFSGTQKWAINWDRFLHFARALSCKPGACVQTRVPRRAACPACAGAASVCAAMFSAPCVCARALQMSAKAEAARKEAGPQVSHVPAMRQARQRMLCSMRGRVLHSAECARAPRPGRRRIRDAGVQRQGPHQAWL